MNDLNWEMIGVIVAIFIFIVQDRVCDWWSPTLTLLLCAIPTALLAWVGWSVSDTLGNEILAFCSNAQTFEPFRQTGLIISDVLVREPIYLSLVGGFVGFLLGLPNASDVVQKMRDPVWYWQVKERKGRTRIEAATSLLESDQVDAAVQALCRLAGDKTMAPTIRLDAADLLATLAQSEFAEQHYLFSRSLHLNRALEKGLRTAESCLAAVIRFCHQKLNKFQLRSQLTRIAIDARLWVAWDWQTHSETRLKAAQALLDMGQTKAARRAWQCVASSDYSDFYARLHAVQVLISLGSVQAAKKALESMARSRTLDGKKRIEAIETLKEQGEEELAAKLFARLASEDK